MSVSPDRLPALAPPKGLHEPRLSSPTHAMPSYPGGLTPHLVRAWLTDLAAAATLSTHPSAVKRAMQRSHLCCMTRTASWDMRPPRLCCMTRTASWDMRPPRLSCLTYPAAKDDSKDVCLGAAHVPILEEGACFDSSSWCSLKVAVLFICATRAASPVHTPAQLSGRPDLSI